MSPYSELVKEHFSNPRNVGRIDDYDGIGEVGNPVCGDMTTITIKVSQGRLSDVKFQTLGCGAAVAVSSIVTEKAKGKTLEEALQINPKGLASELGELPKNELHCSHLGAEALHKAIMNYYDRQAGRTRKTRGGKDEHVHVKDAHCYCPYCEHETSGETPVCINCGKSRT
jgi:nitrogen fixation NifU-like protein